MDFQRSAVEEVVSLGSLTNVSLTSGQTVELITNAVQDMRAFGGYYARIDVTVTSAAAYIPAQVNLYWNAGVGPGGGQTAYRETFEWWASTGSPGANQEAVNGGEIYFQDHPHGGTLQLQITHAGAAGTIKIVNADIFGTGRELPRAYLQAPPRDFLFADYLYERAYNPPAAGYTYPLPMYYGNVMIHHEAYVQNQSFTVRFGSSAQVFNLGNVTAAAVIANIPFVFPRRAGLVTVTAAGAGAGAVTLITTQRDRT